MRAPHLARPPPDQRVYGPMLCVSSAELPISLRMKRIRTRPYPYGESLTQTHYHPLSVLRRVLPRIPTTSVRPSRRSRWPVHPDRGGGQDDHLSGARGRAIHDRPIPPSHHARGARGVAPPAHRRGRHASRWTAGDGFVSGDDRDWISTRGRIGGGRVAKGAEGRPRLLATEVEGRPAVGTERFLVRHELGR
jgi:hypothetical protein